MLILIPVKGSDPKEALIAPRMEAEQWALVDFDAGEVRSVTFHPDWDRTGADWIDFAVLENRFENAMDLMEAGMMVLARREGQDTIELVIEGFKFKELDEIGF
ncbi:MAG TPA: hypothetical protein ENJ74_02755 [Nitratifractor salsuginis]|uniref:Uncharacterized protein n=1 Tax=Nitratifractor salsuginis TaxID=269261 RepID=A0A7V2SIR3_9BACT|nr:hypothetical protein [Nitratifractor salsuginis]